LTAGAGGFAGDYDRKKVDALLTTPQKSISCKPLMRLLRLQGQPPKKGSFF